MLAQVLETFLYMVRKRLRFCFNFVNLERFKDEAVNLTSFKSKLIGYKIASFMVLDIFGKNELKMSPISVHYSLFALPVQQCCY